MLKGVNKQILEVTNTDNPYFEKIIFFVKPQHQKTDIEKLKKEADDLANSAQKPPKAQLKKREVFAYCASGVLFALTGCGMTLLINLLIK